VNRTVTVPDKVDPGLYAQALADVIQLRPYGTYRPRPEKLPPTTRPDCGSRRGYDKHLRAGERTCQRCRDANAAADRRLRETGTSKAVAQ
jgi:hypothetical protein